MSRVSCPCPWQGIEWALRSFPPSLFHDSVECALLHPETPFQTVELCPRKAPQLFTVSLRLEGTQELGTILNVTLQQVGTPVWASGFHSNGSISMELLHWVLWTSPRGAELIPLLPSHLLELHSSSECLKLKETRLGRAGAPAGAGLCPSPCSTRHILHKVLAEESCD